MIPATTIIVYVQTRGVNKWQGHFPNEFLLINVSENQKRSNWKF